MADWASSSNGSQTATLTTEHELANPTAAGTYVLKVDIANLAADERVTLRVYSKARTSDTERVQWSATVTGSKPEKLVVMPPIETPHYARFTLEQNGGTGRAFPWEVDTINAS